MKRRKPTFIYIEWTRNLPKHIAVGIEYRSHLDGDKAYRRWLLHPTKGWRPV